MEGMEWADIRKQKIYREIYSGYFTRLRIVT